VKNEFSLWTLVLFDVYFSKTTYFGEMSGLLVHSFPTGNVRYWAGKQEDPLPNPSRADFAAPGTSKKVKTC